MNSKAFTTPQLIIFVLALAVIVGGYFAFGPKIQVQSGCIKYVGGVVGIQNDCSQISQCDFYKNKSDKSSENDCYFGVATKNKDVAVCNLISEETQKEGCLKNIGLSTSTISQVDTTGWQTYTNNQYGFEVKYPDDFYQGISGSGTAYFRETRFQNSELTHPFIEIQVYKKGSLSNGEFIDGKTVRIEELTGQNLVLKERIDGTSSGYSTYLLSFGSTGSAYLIRGDTVFEIYWWGNFYRDIISQILSTFKFIR